MAGARTFADVRNERPGTTTWLRSAALADGRVVDVRLDLTTGTIAEVAEARRRDPRTPEPAAPAEPHHDAAPAEIDLEGYLLLPAPAEPHAHLDKALAAESAPNPKGDLLGAIDAWIAFGPHLTVEDMAERGRTAALELLASGVTAVRTHVDVHGGIGLRALEALLGVRDDLRGLLDLQIVALLGSPYTHDEGRSQRELLTAALDSDPAVIVGGCPHLDPDPIAASEWSLQAAMRHGRPIDLHTDETLDPGHLELRHLAQRVRETGFDLGATASHCVSLGMQPHDVQLAVADEVAASGVAVVSLPQTNLFLQGREHRHGVPRGLTALRPLLDAGATLAAGADNVRDPFNSMGRSDPFETAALLVMAGHLLPHEAYAAVSNGARRAMGLPAVTVTPGAPAELVAVVGSGLADAVARADQQRMVWHRGRLVHSTAVRRSLARPYSRRP